MIFVFEKEIPDTVVDILTSLHKAMNISEKTEPKVPMTDKQKEKEKLIGLYESSLLQEWQCSALVNFSMIYHARCHDVS